MRSILVVLGGALVVGCVTPAPAPPLRTVQVSDWRANTRSYSAANICDAEPRWLFDELTSVNGVLARFLKATEEDEQGRSTEKQLRLLEETRSQLADLATEHLNNVTLAQRCSFAQARGFPMVLERGELLSRDTRAVVAGAEARIERARALAALERWQRERPREELNARLTCPDRPPAKPSIYYAYEDEQRRAFWLFCGGARVVGTPRSPAVFDTEAAISPAFKRRLKPKEYLEAARNYPVDRVSRPPEVPAEQSANARAPGPSGG